MTRASQSDSDTSSRPLEPNLGALARIPRKRLARRVAMMLAVLAAAQAAIAMSALLLLENASRTASASETQQAIAAVAAQRMSTEFLHARSAPAQAALDAVTREPAVSYALVVNADQQTVLSSGAIEPGVEAPTASMAITDPRGGTQHEIVLGFAPRHATGPLGLPFRDQGAIAVSAALAITLALLVPVAYIRLHRWSVGLAHLHVSIRRLAKGITPDPVPVSGEDEIAYLALAFNNTAGSLLGTQRELTDANTTLERRVSERTADLCKTNACLDQKNRELNEITEKALRFADDVAHEFRTPLAVVKEFVSLISDGIAGETTPKQREYLAFTSGAVSDLVNLVDDFLDSSKLRAGSFRIDRGHHCIGNILDDAWAMLESRAQNAGIQLRRDIAHGLPQVYADSGKIRRVLVNLVVNAIKFSMPGQNVTITAGMAACNMMKISVRDEGKGMSAEEVAGLFQRFQQGREGERCSSKGFGLGLTIVRDMVDINFGEVSVASDPGKGSSFSFTIPAADHATVLSAFVRRMRRESTPTPCVAFRVAAGGNAEAVSAALSVTMRPHDLALRAHDGRSLLLLGPRDDASVWVKSMQEQWAAAGESAKLGPLHAEHVGFWSPEELDTDALLALTGSPPDSRSDRRCA